MPSSEYPSEMRNSSQIGRAEAMASANGYPCLMTFFAIMKPEMVGMLVHLVFFIVMQLAGLVDVDSAGNKYKSVVLNRRNEITRAVVRGLCEF